MIKDRWLVKVYSHRFEVIQDTMMGLGFNTIYTGILCTRFYTNDHSKINGDLIKEMRKSHKKNLLEQKKKSEIIIFAETERLNLINENLSPLLRSDKLKRIKNNLKIK